MSVVVVNSSNITSPGPPQPSCSVADFVRVCVFVYLSLEPERRGDADVTNYTKTFYVLIKNTSGVWAYHVFVAS